MATWLDRERGTAQGRIVPSTLAPAAGEHIFALGGDAIEAPATLTRGAYSQVRQDVDLTDWDVVAATIETRGVPAAQFIIPDRLLVVPGETLALWPLFEDGWAGGRADGGTNEPRLLPVGDVAVGVETYSTAGRACRTFPSGGATAQLSGVNTPRLWATALPTYTFECFLNFRADDYADSTGLNFDLFRCETAGGGGLRIYLAGVGASHEWLLAMDHTNGGVTVTQTCPSYGWTTSDGWHHVALVYDGMATGAAQLALYIDGLFASAAVDGIYGLAGAPVAGEVLTVGDPGLWGAISQVRLSNVAHDASEVAADYLTCTTAPATELARWRMSLLIGGTPYCTRVIRPTEARRLVDFRAPVRHLTGVQSVIYRLSLEAV